MNIIGNEQYYLLVKSLELVGCCLLQLLFSLPYYFFLMFLTEFEKLTENQNFEVEEHAKICLQTYIDLKNKLGNLLFLIYFKFQIFAIMTMYLMISSVWNGETTSIMIKPVGYFLLFLGTNLIILSFTLSLDRTYRLLQSLKIKIKFKLGKLSTF